MNDYPLRVKIVASLAIVLAYACLPLFGLVYATAALADWKCQRRLERARSCQ